MQVRYSLVERYRDPPWAMIPTMHHVEELPDAGT
jgi:hypothetical protein